MTSDDRPADILGESKPLAKVFSSDYVFSIPNYQRPYAWTTEEADELLTDVLAFLGDDPETDSTPVQDLKPYFLGSIVLIKQPHRPEATVVDGQQRLTTLTLLFALLRDLAPSETLRAELVPFVRQEGNSMTGTEEQPRLTLRSRDETFFRDHVQAVGRLAEIGSSKPENDAQRNLRDNAVALHALLTGLSERVRSRLGAYLLQRCFLVVVSTPDRASAYRIFSVMNNRGLDLTATDILKAEVIGALASRAPSEEAEYTARWEATEEALGRDRFLELFGHIRTIHRKVKRKETLLDEVQKHVRPADRPRGFIDTELVPYSEVFVQARGHSFGEAGSKDSVVRSINQSLEWLGRVDNADWLPVAMVLLRHVAQDRERLAAALSRLERLASAMMVYRANVNGRMERYAAVLAHLEGPRAADGAPAWSGDPLAHDSPLDLQPDEHGRVLDALDGDVYAVTRTRLFILLRLNDALTDGAASYHPDVITVEHVLPQNPAEDSAWALDFTDGETRAAYVHKLGNLVLLSRQRNASAGRLPFEEKKASYFGTDFSSAFVLTSKVLSHDEWTPDVIESRQADLLGVLARAWRLDLDRWHRGAESSAGSGALAKSVLGYLARSSPQTQALFERLDERLKAFDGVSRSDYKTILSYTWAGGAKSPIVASVKVQPTTSTVVVFLPLDPDTVDLRDGFTRDMRGIGKHGAGSLEVRIRSGEDLRASESLLHRAYTSTLSDG